jgi:hypothetical protein
VVTLLGISIDDKPLQPLKTLRPNETTLFGISIDNKPLQPWNALNIDNQRFVL